MFICIFVYATLQVEQCFSLLVISKQAKKKNNEKGNVYFYELAAFSPNKDCSLLLLFLFSIFTGRERKIRKQCTKQQFVCPLNYQNVLLLLFLKKCKEERLKKMYNITYQCFFFFLFFLMFVYFFQCFFIGL